MNRIFLTAPAAFLVSATILFATAAPATAAESCAAADIRTAAASADPGAAKRALGYASIGEKLCAEGNERAANKKFKAAKTALGLRVSPHVAARLALTAR